MERRARCESVCYNLPMDSDNKILSSDDLLSIDETSIAKPNVTLATLDLRWIMAAFFAVALFANLVVPICIEGWQRYLPKWNITIYDFRWSEWIGGIAYGVKLGELLLIGVFLAIGNYHWSKRLFIASSATLVLGSAHIVGYRWAGWAPPLFVAVMCYLISFSVTLAVGIFVGLISKWNRWILDRQSLAPSVNQISHQFDTRLLFGIMISVAICIPLLKATLSLTDVQSPAFNEVLASALWSVWLVTALCSMVTLQTIAFLVPRAMKTKVAFGTLILAGPFLFQWVAQTILPLRLSWPNLLMAYGVAIGVIGSLSLVFVLLRLMGYQLRRRE